MSPRVDSDPEDGIVYVELALDTRWEIEAVVGCLRAGAAAFMHLPFASTAVVPAIHTRDMSSIGRRVADEIESEALATATRRSDALRARAKERDDAARRAKAER